MSLLKQIYSIEPLTYVEEPHCAATLIYGGKSYIGNAKLAPEDKDFFSSKVGLEISLSRARLKLLKEVAKKAKTIADIKYQMYKEVCIDHFFEAESNPLIDNIIKAQRNYDKLRKAIKREKKYLRNYLRSQDQLVTSIKRQRETEDKDD